jgi:hypothetical protein
MMTAVTGRRPLHRIAKPYPLMTGCGFPVVAGAERRIEVNLARRDLCRTCSRARHGSSASGVISGT